MQAVPTLIATAGGVRPIARRPAAFVARLAAAVAVAATLQLADAAAQPRAQSDPGAFVAALRDELIAAGAPERPDDEARAAVDRIVNRAFDLSSIAAAALRPVDQTATPVQRERLSRALGRRMALEILRRRHDAGGVAFQVAGVRTIAAAEWLVATHVTPQGDTAAVVGWRVREFADGLRIIDVTRDGVSIVLTQRQEIASALRAGRSLDSVLDDIERRNEAVAGRP